VKILHTADIHLREYGDERWNTLVSLVELARVQAVDLLVVSGDLFDRPRDVEELRPRLREVFDGGQFHTLIIPGNHDAGVYREGMYLGTNVTLLTTSAPWEELDAIRVVGLPFEPLAAEHLILKLRTIGTQLTSDRCNILVFHGELLDVFFSRHDFGDEGTDRYMPVRLSYFADLNVDYVLAGHFHSRFDVWNIGDHRYFVYPGSPISITARETGRRKVNLFQAGEAPMEHPLDTPHFEEIILTLNPYSREHPLDLLGHKLEELHYNARGLLTVKGFMNGRTLEMTEEEVVQRMTALARSRCHTTTFEFKDVQRILDDDLFQRFMTHLSARVQDQDERELMSQMAVTAMTRALS